jgi:uncharacterized protein YbbK (DUF523 family)
MSCETVLVSTCLLGIPCQYDGQLAKTRFEKKEIEKLDFHLVPVCPEQLSGLPTPRKSVEIQCGDGMDVLSGGARVVSQDGEYFTEQFIRGAENVLLIAKTIGATKMITQFRSPSCSSCKIYDGNFNHSLRSGLGVCAALLQSNGIELIDVDAVRNKKG